MSCAFDLAHYRELLEAAQAGGYRFAHFDGAPGRGRPDPAPRRRPLARRRRSRWPSSRHERAPGDVLPDDAIVFYNLDSTRGRRRDRAAARARATASRLTPSSRTRPRRALRARRRLAQPRSRVHARAVGRRVNVMQAPWFDPDHYRSDSNQHWRHGCPHDELARGAFEWLQLLTHPGDLGLRRRDDGRDDAGVARRRARAAPARAPRRRTGSTSS